MNSSQNRRYSLYLGLPLMLMLLFAACQLKSPCDHVPCYNGGICIEGDCNCAYGWGGDSCTILLDSCGIMECGPNAYDCKNGTCLCNTGWEGDSCHILSKLKFLGNFASVEDCNGLIQPFPVTFTNSYNDSTLLLMLNFKNMGNSDSLLISVIHDSLAIIPQTTLSGFTVFTGNGRINTARDTVWMTYGYFDTGTGATDTCNVVMIRQ